MPTCWFCRTKLTYPPLAAVPRDAECPSCSRDLHSCKNCRHFDPGVHNQCREPNSEWVTDRERSNFCEFYQLAEEPLGRASTDRSVDARKKLDGLFRKPD